MRTAIALAGALLCAMTGGCALFEVGAQQAKLAQRCTVSGTVSVQLPEPVPGQDDASIVVALFRHTGGERMVRANWQLFDFTVLDKPGQWTFDALPGEVAVSATLDVNRNLSHDPGEPTFVPTEDQLLTCTDRHEQFVQNIVINTRTPTDSMRVDFFGIRIGEQQAELSNALESVALTAGEVTTLDDPAFARERATMGLWRPYDFITQTKSGIYFLQPFDPSRTPVLFIHGLSGTPTDFRTLIGALDQRRFQPWVAYYPSGVPLAPMARRLGELLREVRMRYGVGQVVVVAHSMGTLVSRAMLLSMAQSGENFVPLYVTIAGPWNGVASAGLGIRQAPTPVWSWVDLAPGSDFLANLFYQGKGKSRVRRHLPGSMQYELIFSYLPDESSDGVVALTSQLRVEAQDDAYALHGVQASHVGVLSDPRTLGIVGKLLRQIDTPVNAARIAP
jgi:pimeloyl-ACP methyl ester carboxylesterase